MTETVSLPNVMVKNVFLALRTDFFGDQVEDEHITLKYYGHESFNKVIEDARILDQYVPTQIHLNGFANWVSAGIHYEVALVESFGNPALWTKVRTPHITIRKSNKPLSNATFVPEVYGVDVELIDRLWLGKKVRGHIRWMPVDGRGIADFQKIMGV